MNHHAILIVALLALLAGCSGKELGAPTWSEDAVAWGQPVNGLQVGIARRAYESGTAPDPGQTYFSLKLRNSGRSNLKLLIPVKPRIGTPELPLAGDESVEVKFEYALASGGTRSASFKPSVRPVLIDIPPGETQSFELRIVPGKFKLDKFLPGRISAVYSNAQPSIDYGSAGAGPVQGLWTGKAASESIAVESSEAPQATSTK